MIDRIDVLVHPFHTARDNHELLRHPTYVELIGIWKSIMQTVSQTPEMALIIFSQFIDIELERSRGLAQFENRIVQPCLSSVFNNIMRYSATDQSYRLSETFSRRGLTTSPGTMMYVYGEVDDNACVQGWGNLARERLNIAYDKYHVIHDWSVSNDLAIQMLSRTFS